MRNKISNIEEVRVRFRKIKKIVQKQYPGASTKIDAFGKYYVTNNRGFRILEDTLLYPAQDNVYDAWYIVSVASKFEKIIEANNRRFSDEKICKKTSE